MVVLTHHPLCCPTSALNPTPAAHSLVWCRIHSAHPLCIYIYPLDSLYICVCAEFPAPQLCWVSVMAPQPPCDPTHSLATPMGHTPAPTSRALPLM